MTFAHNTPEWTFYGFCVLCYTVYKVVELFKAKDIYVQEDDEEMKDRWN